MSGDLRTRLLAAMCAALGALALGGCSDEAAEADAPGPTTGATAPASAAPPPSDPPAPPVLGPFEQGGLTRIARQLASQLGRRPMVIELSLTESSAHFKVQDADRPANVDQYTWRDGAIEGPEPVRFSSANGTLAEHLFPLFSVDLNAAPRLARAARAQPIEGAEPASMIVRRQIPFDTRVTWYVNVSGTRESVQLRARADGTVYDVIR